LLRRGSEQVKRLQKSAATDHEITIIWVPRRTLVSNKILEDQGVLGDVSISELALFFLPLENDLFSLELDDAFNELYLVGLTQPLLLYC
jgi:hypothetical protein